MPQYGLYFGVNWYKPIASSLAGFGWRVIFVWDFCEERGKLGFYICEKAKVHHTSQVWKNCWVVATIGDSTIGNNILEWIFYWPLSRPSESWTQPAWSYWETDSGTVLRTRSSAKCLSSVVDDECSSHIPGAEKQRFYSLDQLFRIRRRHLPILSRLR